MALKAADPDDETYVTSDGGGGSGGSGGGGDPINRDTSGGSPSPSESSPSMLRQIGDFATQGMPLGGGTLKPGKIGSGYGARWSMKFATGGKVSSASKRGDGCAQRGKTKGTLR